MPEKMDEILVEHIVDLFEKKDFKKKLISKLNSNVDIPIINEKTEKKILDKIYDVLVDALNDLWFMIYDFFKYFNDLNENISILVLFSLLPCS